MEPLVCGIPCLDGLQRYVVAFGADLKGWELFQFRDYAGNLRYTVLANRSYSTLYFRQLQSFCYRHGLAYPMEIGSYGTAGICLLYGPLKTLRQLLYEFNFSVPPAMLKNIVHRILSLRKATILLWIINRHTIVWDGLKGSLLFPFYQDNPSNNSSPVADICALYCTIAGLFQEQFQEQPLVIPNDLVCFLECMYSATTPAMCRRLERSPYFLSPYEKIWDFIPRVFQAMHCSGDFGNLVTTTTITHCWNRLYQLPHAEMIAVHRKGNYSNSSVYTLFRYLRNFVQHGIEHYKKLKKIWDVVRGLTENQRRTLTDSDFERLVKAQLGQPNMTDTAYLYHLGMHDGVELAFYLRIFVDGYTLNANSILLHQTDDLLRAINILSPDLFDVVFKMTFKARDSEIGVLDPPT